MSRYAVIRARAEHYIAKGLYAPADLTASLLDAVNNLETTVQVNRDLAGNPAFAPAAVYIAGPMRGYAELNFPAFRAVAAQLRVKGFTIVSPVELNHGADDDGTQPPQAYLRRDLRAIVESCAGMVLLPGWERSVGARCEATIGVSLGFSFFDPDGNPIPTPRAIAIRGGYENPLAEPLGLHPTDHGVGERTVSPHRFRGAL
jgi:hypothetical protein